MMMKQKPRAVALIRHPPKSGDYFKRHWQQTLQAYAAVRDWGEPEIIVDESGLAFLAGGEPGPILKSFGWGTRVVCPSFEHLADSPKELREGLPRLLAQGVELHIAELLGPVAEHLPSLTLAWQHAEPLERDLQLERERHTAQEAEWRKLVDDLVRDVGITLLANTVFLYRA